MPLYGPTESKLILLKDIKKSSIQKEKLPKLSQSFTNEGNVHKDTDLDPNNIHAEYVAFDDGKLQKQKKPTKHRVATKKRVLKGLESDTPPNFWIDDDQLVSLKSLKQRKRKPKTINKNNKKTKK